LQETFKIAIDFEKPDFFWPPYGFWSSEFEKKLSIAMRAALFNSKARAVVVQIVRVRVFLIKESAIYPGRSLAALGRWSTPIVHDRPFYTVLAVQGSTTNRSYRL
jgi:hypothetical protein